MSGLGLPARRSPAAIWAKGRQEGCDSSLQSDNCGAVAGDSPKQERRASSEPVAAWGHRPQRLVSPRSFRRLRRLKLRGEGFCRERAPGVTLTLAKARSVHPRLRAAAAPQLVESQQDRRVLSRTVSRSWPSTAEATKNPNSWLGTALVNHLREDRRGFWAGDRSGGPGWL